MADMANLSWLKGIGLVLLFTTNYAVSNQNSGILSNLYKQAAQQNRPMILVLDNSLNDKAGLNKDQDYSLKSLLDVSSKKTQDSVAAKKKSALAKKKWPFNLISLLPQQNYQTGDQLSKSQVYDHGSIESSNKNRLRSQLDRNDRNNYYDRDDHDNRYNRDRRDRYRDYRDRRERYRDNRNRHGRDRDDRDRRDSDRGDLDRRVRNRDDRYTSDSDRDDRDRYDRDQRNPDRYDPDRLYQIRDYQDRSYKRYRNRDYRDKRNRDGNGRDRYDRDRNDREYILRALVENNLEDVKQPHEKARDNKNERALRTSVIKNLLRFSNDLNCEAQDKCQDSCNTKYDDEKKDSCEDKCETKFECDEKKEKSSSSSDCSLESSCGVEEDKNPSTKGVKSNYDKK